MSGNVGKFVENGTARSSVLFGVPFDLGEIHGFQEIQEIANGGGSVRANANRGIHGGAKLSPQAAPELGLPLHLDYVFPKSISIL